MQLRAVSIANTEVYRVDNPQKSNIVNIDNIVGLICYLADSCGRSNAGYYK